MEVMEVETSSHGNGVFNVRFIGGQGEEITVTIRDPQTGNDKSSLVALARSMLAETAGSDVWEVADADLPPADLQEASRAFSGEQAPPDAAPAESLGEDEDNAYQNSDEALPGRDEERALKRNPSREGGRFDRF